MRMKPAKISLHTTTDLRDEITLRAKAQNISVSAYIENVLRNRLGMGKIDIMPDDFDALVEIVDALCNTIANTFSVVTKEGNHHRHAGTFQSIADRARLLRQRRMRDDT